MLVAVAFFLLFFMINFVENSGKFTDQKGVIGLVIWMSFLNTPSFLTGISSSVILTAAILATNAFSVRSEIVIMRSVGLSLWSIIRPMMISAFLMGLFWILIFDPFAIAAKKQFYRLERNHVDKEMRDAIEMDSGVWLKQENQDLITDFSKAGNIFPENKVAIENKDIKNFKSKESKAISNYGLTKPIILISAKKIYPDSLYFGEISFWFFDKNQIFYKRIDARYAELVDKNWLLKDVVVNDETIINKRIDNLKISTDLDREFVLQKIVNDVKTAEIYSIFELQNLIKKMSDSGLNSTKFSVRFYKLLTMPLVFVAMVLIGAFFGINHVRSGKSNLMIFTGLVCGLTVYVFSSIVNVLGSSGIISIFASTWIVAIIILAIGILIIYSKESH